MDEKKKIDLQKHVSPKVPRSYLIRIVVYVALIGGLILTLYFFQEKDAPAPKKSDANKVEEIHNYTIDTLP